MRCIRKQYDSSAIAHSLDDQVQSTVEPLYPQDPVLGFVARLIDEAFDEFGLYRFITSAGSVLRWITSWET